MLEIDADRRIYERMHSVCMYRDDDRIVCNLSGTVLFIVVWYVLMLVSFGVLNWGTQKLLVQTFHEQAAEKIAETFDAQLSIPFVFQSNEYRLSESSALGSSGYEYAIPQS